MAHPDPPTALNASLAHSYRTALPTLFLLPLNPRLLPVSSAQLCVTAQQVSPNFHYLQFHWRHYPSQDPDQIDPDGSNMIHFPRFFNLDLPPLSWPFFIYLFTLTPFRSLSAIDVSTKYARDFVILVSSSLIRREIFGSLG
ncbi:hypothetical protein K435DRAFT_786532 [Dendrothele bispora CBS 962.96]|uniref:Uncharacterized protein n=1 Tax=Dendrothele bispora (strain CBS 962.96) TaxID=1314807 RepID=A0A4S8KQ83_DENBC|nr:hypothetical protein K435DRAFT_786532 [Dendrothele bispora CBS 962.96]